jgi:hypothetical protein
MAEIFGPLLKWGRPAQRRTQEPEFLADMRANLTDNLYEEMTSNPDGKIPFLVHWPKVQRELTPS